MKLPALLLSLLWITPALAQDHSLLPNPSFETPMNDRPKGWRVFTTPSDLPGKYYLSTAQEGVDSHSGAAALQVQFPQETELTQCVWMADVTHGGSAVTPGKYSCAFWIKAEDMMSGFHAWVSITGYNDAKSRVGEVGRSSYLQASDLPQGEWTKIQFSFDVPNDGSITRIAPSFVFKTHPDSTPNAVPPSTRILLDDLEISKN